MNITIKFTPSLEGLIKRLGEDISGGLRSGMINLVEKIEAKAVENAPKSTGNLADSITSSVTQGGSRGEIKATAPYAPFVHFGTGLFGPHKKKIVPTTKKALFWEGAKHPVRSVKGMKARPFLYDAAKEVDPQATFEEGIMNYLRKKGW